HPFDGLVAHLERVLEDERVNRAGLEVFDQVRAGVEADQNDLAGQTLLLDGLHRADGRRFVGGEEAVEVRVRGEDVRRAVERAGAVALAILKRDDLDAGVLLLDRLLKPLLALVGRDRAGLDAEDGDTALPAEFRGEAVGGDRAALPVVCGDVGDVVLRADAGVEDRDGDALALRAFDDGDERVAVRGREHDAGDAPVDGVLDDVDLAGVVGLLRRAVPRDLDVRLLARRVRARVDALPEEVRDALRDDGDDALAAAAPPAASGHEQEGRDYG